MTPAQAWSGYLAAVEAAAVAVVERVREGREPLWPELRPPGVPFPGGLQVERDRVLAALDRAAAETSSRRDTVAGELSALSARRRPAPAATATGGRLDILG